MRLPDWLQEQVEETCNSFIDAGTLDESDLEELEELLLGVLEEASGSMDGTELPEDWELQIDPSPFKVWVLLDDNFHLLYRR